MQVYDVITARFDNESQLPDSSQVGYRTEAAAQLKRNVSKSFLRHVCSLGA